MELMAFDPGNIIMTEDTTPQEAPNASPTSVVDRELVLTLNFVPAWARQPPSATSFYRERPDRGERGEPRGRDGNERRPERRERREQRPEQIGRAHV